MNLIGQSAVIFLSLLNCVACQLQLQCYQKPKWFKKCPIVVPQAQTLQTSLIILVDLTVLILSDKLLLDIQLTHTFMPNMIHKPWMVPNIHWKNNICYLLITKVILINYETIYQSFNIKKSIFQELSKDRNAKTWSLFPSPFNFIGLLR